MAKVVSKEAVVGILVALPINIFPLFRLGVSLLRPAPIILMLPLLLSPLTTFAIFCTKLPSPVGGVVSKVPALVADTYNSVPVSIPVVSICMREPNVSISTFPPCSAFTIPKAGILEDMAAFAFATTVF